MFMGMLAMGMLTTELAKEFNASSQKEATLREESVRGILFNIMGVTPHVDAVHHGPRRRWDHLPQKR